MSIKKVDTAIVVGSGGGIGKALKNELLSEISEECYLL